ncbi:ribosomal protein S18 acetylase RimI-like enzyme [Anaerosolibacter carboniphilus]|uniref:Ribosomal protein S18 acetylase RimI-like enzyme n=1 Tax=Anaerosolibacter carboniphilus TaxID=1417629 RepID=A0A841L228_9FIRM|nr:GNAT family N-acetyltransferase [Anaerosolibacter carboniphilus]MBB6218230.1 ribosomal protein S18 acetylase RimI-like enzyme [Anaerosolibacter carboniphilus]
MEIVFREMFLNDVPKVVDLFQELAMEKAEVSFAEILSADEIKDWLTDEDVFVYVALREEELLAVFRGIRGKQNKNHAAYLTAAVGKKHRGYRLAKDITLYSLERLKEAGIKLVRTYVYSNNRPSINTVLSCGFTFAGSVYQHHYDEASGIYIDDLIFHKLL